MTHALPHFITLTRAEVTTDWVGGEGPHPAYIAKSGRTFIANPAYLVIAEDVYSSGEFSHCRISFVNDPEGNERCVMEPSGEILARILGAVQA